MERRDLIPVLLTYLTGFMVLAGSFILIYQSRGDAAQAWLAIGTVLGYMFRDSGAAAAVRNSERQASVLKDATPNIVNKDGGPTTIVNEQQQ